MTEEKIPTTDTGVDPGLERLEVMYVAWKAGELTDYEIDQLHSALTARPQSPTWSRQIQHVWNLLTAAYAYRKSDYKLSDARRSRLRINSGSGGNTGPTKWVTYLFKPAILTSLAALLIFGIWVPLTWKSNQPEMALMFDHNDNGVTPTSSPSSGTASEPTGMDGMDFRNYGFSSGLREPGATDLYIQDAEDQPVIDNFSVQVRPTAKPAIPSKRSLEDASPYSTAMAETWAGGVTQSVSGPVATTRGRIMLENPGQKAESSDKALKVSESLNRRQVLQPKDSRVLSDVEASPMVDTRGSVRELSRENWFAEPSAALPLTSESLTSQVAAGSRFSFQKGVTQPVPAINRLGRDNLAQELKEMNRAPMDIQNGRGGQSDELYDAPMPSQNAPESHWEFQPSGKISQLGALVSGIAAESDDLKQLTSDKKLSEGVEDVLSLGRGLKSEVLNLALDPASESEPFPEVETAGNALSTFSLNVSDVSFELAHESLMNGVMPDRQLIRSEEFLNAFHYRDPQPGAEEKFRVTVERAEWPFEMGREVMRVGVKASATGLDRSGGLNLVILADTSGSMEREDRKRTLVRIMDVLESNLSEGDVVTFIGFAMTPTLWLDGQPGGTVKLAELVSGLRPSGGTHLESALALASEKLFTHFLQGGSNRILLLTDGAANLGEIRGGSLSRMVQENRLRGGALDCFGIGWDGYDDELLEELTRHGDGRYGFLSSPGQAQEFFEKSWLKSVEVAASDVKVQVEFNPNRVRRYRQIGYQKHRLTAEQFRDNTVDAAEIGKAESGQALYTMEVDENGSGPIGWVRIRYRDPVTQSYHESDRFIDYRGPAPQMSLAPPSMRLAVAASAFGEWLGGNPYATQIELSQLYTWAQEVAAVYHPDTQPIRLMAMIQAAQLLNP